MNKHVSNVDEAVVNDFGNEWTRFDQSSLSEEEVSGIFKDYFRIFPWDSLPPEAVGADVGCGSGRWARLVAPRVGHLHCVEPSNAIRVARRNLTQHPNVSFHQETVGNLPFAADSLDFVYSLGVLHHVPDTQAAIQACVDVLKPGAVLLLYLYYRFDNRPRWFQQIWKASDMVRQKVSTLPPKRKSLVADVLATTVYLPLSRFSKGAEALGLDVQNIPLSAYRDKSFYTMRTDSLDRFGTKLEHRFTRDEIAEMLVGCRMDCITFSDESPFWCVVARKPS